MAIFPLLLGLSACESDAAKLTRLHADRATACLPVYRADSARQAQYLAVASIEAKSATNVQEAQSNVVEAEHALAELRRFAALTPAQVKHEDDSTAKARTSCELAERALTRFMAGR